MNMNAFLPPVWIKKNMKINVARFARNVVKMRLFKSDFQTLCSSLSWCTHASNMLWKLWSQRPPQQQHPCFQKMDPLSLTTTKGKGFFIVLEAMVVLLAHARESKLLLCSSKIEAHGETPTENTAKLSWNLMLTLSGLPFMGSNSIPFVWTLRYTGYTKILPPPSKNRNILKKIEIRPQVCP